MACENLMATPTFLLIQKSQLLWLLCVILLFWLELDSVTSVPDIIHIPLKKAATLPRKHMSGLLRSARSVTHYVHDLELHGQPGQGYYVEFEVGTPPQKVSF